MTRSLLLLVVAVTACAKKDPEPTKEAPALTVPVATTVPAPSTSAPPAATAESLITDLVVGTGAQASAGKKITVHYTLWLSNGMKRIESSHDKNKPKTFRLGAGGVIKGWDLGIEGMKVGGKRKLIVPPQLGYGGAGAPPSIPGNATLVFEIELLDAKP